MQEVKHTILCVDDEPNILQALKRLLRREEYRMLTANSGREALEILAGESVHLIISDQRMPGMSGTEFLARVKDDYPDVLRVILSGYTDVDSITESINKGHIYKFFLKPWNDHTLKLEIRQALEQYDLVQANRSLDRKIREQNEQLRHINENLEDMVAARTREIAMQNQALALSHAIFEDLPLPIVGLDVHAVVMLVNKPAMDLLRGSDLKVGHPLVACFREDMPAVVRQVIDSGKPRQVSAQLASGQCINALLSPFSGVYRAKGAIMTLADNL